LGAVHKSRANSKIANRKTATRRLIGCFLRQGGQFRTGLKGISAGDFRKG
jgi:hypothetical protein